MFKFLALMFAVFSSLAWAAPNFVSFKSLNWSLVNVKNSDGTVFFVAEDFATACKDSLRVPTTLEWNEFALERFTGPRKINNVKSFIQKTRGYMVPKKKKKQGIEAAYFAIADNKMVMRLDPKRGSFKMVNLPKQAKVNVRCVAPRDIYAEKNISQKDMVLKDPRDGKMYPVEQRENKIWMKKNLEFSLQNAKQCFLEDTLFCKKHGRFYTHNEAKKACPKGWHLPDDGEWRDYQKDRAKLDWNNLGVGGCKDWDEYCDEANTGHYWSATSITKNTGRSWEFRREVKSINRTDESVLKGLYVRCVTNLEE